MTSQKLCEHVGRIERRTNGEVPLYSTLLSNIVRSLTDARKQLILSSVQ